MKKKIAVVFSVLTVIIGLAAIPYAQKAIADQTQNQYVKDAKQIVSQMSKEDQIYQTFFMYCTSWEGKPVTELPPTLAKFFEERNFGGVVLFEANCKDTVQTLNLCKQLQSASTKDPSHIPLLITTDQEGGRVVRLDTGTSMPGNMGIGATNKLENAYRNGTIIGSELESLAINTDYSPVVDVNNNANNPVIGLRSFSDNPNFVADYGEQYRKGLHDSGVATCAKHFPGHGDTGKDSHADIPQINRSWEELEKCELIPFRRLIENDVDMIMTAHIQYPLVDDASVISEKDGSTYYRTATTSKTILTDKLKGEMGFNGVVSTDGMHMNGISMLWHEPQAAYEALNAGADMMCGPTSGTNTNKLKESIDAIMNKLITEYDHDPSFTERIQDAATRVVALKIKSGVINYDPNKYTEERAKATVGKQENRNDERRIAAEGVTVTKNNNNALPLHITNNSKVLFYNQNNPTKENLAAQIAIGWNRAKEVGLIPQGAQLTKQGFDASFNDISGERKQAIDGADTVIVNSMLSNSKQMGYKDFQTKAVQDCIEYCRANGKKVIVLSNYNTYDVQLYPNADAIVTVYGAKGSTEEFDKVLNEGTTWPSKTFGPNTIAGMEVILGVYGAQGVLPINIPKWDGTQYTNEIVYQRGYGITYDPITNFDKVNINIEFKEVEYNGKAQCPKVICTVQDTNKVLTEDKEYQVEYKDNVNVGTATVIVTGVGSYIGQQKAHFNIVQAKVDPSSGGNTPGGASESDNASSLAQTGDTIAFVLFAMLLTSIIVATWFATKRYRRHPNNK